MKFCLEQSAVHTFPGGFNQGTYGGQNTALYGAFINGALNQGNANQELDVRRGTPKVNINQGSEDAQRAALYEAFIKGNLNQATADQGLSPRIFASKVNYNQATSPNDDDSLRAALYESFMKGALNQGNANQGFGFGRSAPKTNSKQGTSPRDDESLRAALYESFIKGSLNQGTGNQGLNLFRNAPDTSSHEKSSNKIISSNNEDIQRSALFEKFIAGLQDQEKDDEGPNNSGFGESDSKQRPFTKDEDSQRTALYEAFSEALSQGTNVKELQKAALEISFILGKLSHGGAPQGAHNFRTPNQNDEARKVAIYADFLNDLNQGYIIQAQRIKKPDANETGYGIEKDLHAESDQDNSFQSDVTTGKGNATLVTTETEEEMLQGDVMPESRKEDATAQADVPATVGEEDHLERNDTKATDTETVNITTMIPTAVEDNEIDDLSFINLL